MKPNGRKTWLDPLIEIANSRKTKAEKKLWGVLRAIARFKDRPPKKIIDEIDRVNRKYHLTWINAPPQLGQLMSPRESLKIIIDESGRKILHWVNDENPERWVMVPGEDGKPIEVLDEITVVRKIPERDQKYFRPHLGSWESWESKFLYDYYLFELIPRLRDPDWVAALRICPGCGNLLMSSAKWEKKFCGARCNKRNWARVNRTRVYCLAEKKEITLLECRQTQKDLPYDECETCPNQPKKGGRHGSMR